MALEDFLNRGFCFAPDTGADSAVAEPETVESEVETPEPATTEPAGGTPEPTPEPVADPHAELLQTLQAFGVPSEREGAAAYLRDLVAQRQQNAQLRTMLWQIEQQKAQTPAAAPTPAQQATWNLPWGKAPDFDPAQLNSITAEDLQNDLMLKKQYQDFMNWQRKGTQTLLSDPVNALWGGFEPKVQEAVKQMVAQHLQQTQQQQVQQQFQQRLSSYYEQNKSWMEDPITRQPTQWAQFWGNKVKEAQQFNMPDPLGYAEMAIDAELMRLKQMEEIQTPATPAAPPKDPRTAFLQARNKPGRSGSVARPNGKKSPPQNANDPWGNLRAALEEGVRHDANFLDDN